jgi:mono/diheme cytochrome c family protein
MKHSTSILAAAFVMTVSTNTLAQQQAEAAGNPLEGSADAAREGHALFNQTCSHCHGPDASTPISERNLRKLRLRYGDQMTEMFHTTVENGRPDAGMPTWAGVIDETTIWKIYTYLETVQVNE